MREFEDLKMGGEWSLTNQVETRFIACPALFTPAEWQLEIEDRVRPPCGRELE